MGEHLINPRAQAAAEPRRTPEFMLKGGLTARRALKKQYYLVPHGENDPEVAGKEPVYEGQEFDESKMDLVVTCDGIFIEPSVLAMNNRTPGAQIGLVELARVDWLEFKERAKRTLREELGVPNFIED